MTLDLTQREVTAWVEHAIMEIDRGLDAATRRRSAAIELAAIERHGLAGRVPNMVRALKTLIDRIDNR